MTHDPRLPTVEEVLNGSPFDIIDSPWGHIERWRASTLATGSMGALSSVYDIVRADASAAAARADADEARTALIQHVCDKITDFEKRFDALEARLAEAEDKRRADEARQAAFNEEPIELPPDIAEYQSREPAKPIADNTPAPDGHLHVVAAKEEPSEDPSEDPDLEIEDAEGDLPNELLEDVPPASGTHPDPELPKSPVVSQPVSISLNKE